MPLGLTADDTSHWQVWRCRSFDLVANHSGVDDMQDRRNRGRERRVSSNESRGMQWIVAVTESSLAFVRLQIARRR